jgi:hypothetical protein
MNDRDADRAETIRQIAAILATGYLRLRFPDSGQNRVDCPEPKSESNAWGRLSERARRRALEIANDSDLHIRAPKNFLKDDLDEARTTDSYVAPTADPRLPKPGAELVRRYRGKNVAVRIRDDGLEYGGQLFRHCRHLSPPVGFVVDGSQWLGFAMPRLAAARPCLLRSVL